MLCLLTANTFAQNVGIGTLTPDASAQLEINSSTKGLLIPRTTTASIASPVTGLLIFDTGTNSFQFYNGASWVELSTGAATNYWTQTGNNLTNNNTGNIGINFASPGERLHIDGNLKLGNSTWSTSANDRFLKIGDGNFVTIGETGQDDRMQLSARNFIFQPSSGGYPGNIGIGLTTPASPLSFAQVLGDKINLWNTDATHNYGLGVQGGLLQIHTNTNTADIVFGNGSSAVFNETVRFTGTGNVGIGVNPTAKLEVNGTTKTTSLQMTTGAAANKILQSDGAGNASWVSPSSIITYTQHAIGESYGGGIVFYVYENGQHGLIAATIDESVGIQWYNGTYITTNAIRDGIEVKTYNTEHIISNQGAGNYAAMICAKYTGGGYGDWYLPSKYELDLLYNQKALVGFFFNNPYWSSTEIDNGLAWCQNFSSGGQFPYTKINTCNVRAIRAF